MLPQVRWQNHKEFKKNCCDTGIPLTQKNFDKQTVFQV